MKILLHICCSNCSLYPVKILQSEGHDFSGFWFNPNIHPLEEYSLRLDSLRKLVEKWSIDMNFINEYEPEEYFKLFDITDTDLLNNVRSGSSSGWSHLLKLKGLSFPERCSACYRLRLEKTAEHARERGFDALTSTLLISPYQDIEKITEIGKKLADKYETIFYFKDFRPCFRDAMALSRELGLYRQKYCGCIFSWEERKQKGGKGRKGCKAGKGK
jgi:predicted adenine nucleotide alpha hydrolase (AANH) superfamily ATPase